MIDKEIQLPRKRLKKPQAAAAAGGPDGPGGFALETAGGEQRMLFMNGGAAPD